MKLYQKHTQTNLTSALVFTAASAALTFPVFFALGGFSMHVTALTACIAGGLAVVNVVANVNSIKILSYGNLSVYSLFLMLGAMALPYLFGILAFSEPLTDLKIVGIVVLTVSLVLSSRDGTKSAEKPKKGFYWMCLFAFLLNGIYNSLAAVQGKGWAEGANNTVWGMEVSGLYDYLSLTKLFTVAASFFALPLVFRKGKEERRAELLSVRQIFTLKPMLAGLLFTVVSVAGFVFQQICTPHLDSSVLFPVTTGGTVVLSAVFARIFYKEKTSGYLWFCILLTAIATVLFMLGSMFPTTLVLDLFR